eukprot:GEZU01006132.1.p1 GENE.GEZU01006132.1~~GEZU01006132.1.p1  ORF type:complete len:130 (-),score=49.74 GEZU01006132.1:461-850(-)
MIGRNTIRAIARVSAPKKNIVNATLIAARQRNGNFARRFYAESAASFLSKEEVTERVLNVIKNFEKVDPTKVTPKSHFINDLGLDSLDAVEVVLALEQEFALEIPDKEAENIVSAETAINYISSHPQAK